MALEPQTLVAAPSEPEPSAPDPGPPGGARDVPAARQGIGDNDTPVSPKRVLTCAAS